MVIFSVFTTSYLTNFGLIVFIYGLIYGLGVGITVNKT